MSAAAMTIFERIAVTSCVDVGLQTIQRPP
jgi:hypothetical protein